MSNSSCDGSNKNKYKDTPASSSAQVQIASSSYLLEPYHQSNASWMFVQAVNLATQIPKPNALFNCKVESPKP